MSELRRLPARIAGHLAWRARRAGTVVADRFRRGDRTVTMTPPVGLRFGNWLYLWLQAHESSAAGRPWLVLEAPGMAEWLDAFPGLREFTVARDEVRFHDRRVWGERFWNQKFGEEFSRRALDAFIADVLAPHIPVDDSDTVVVNVRRGDYYAQDHLRARYAFDQAGYIADALERIGPAARIRLVSDDPEWCRKHLGVLLSHHADEVVYEPRGAVGNFLAVSGSRKLIGTNSTFSYWGGYIAGVLHSDAQIVMPRFHARTERGTDAYHLDPSWTIIDGYH
ncbi:alpha-1,2-fucosyltransferase [Microbacterium sp. LTA6]|uniref:alpha-1,2-fucosyltransferase n=1 Tax=Microbacterium sp. LTA6 TaxID=3129771 RepID=UPI0032530A4A